uniref:G-protein coupled receptors family 1 profile domain-containing protein n=1 Tax=Anguilla anguilla TaxID=7936 RepID=A0A0E9V0Q1_ANGAN
MCEKHQWNYLLLISIYALVLQTTQPEESLMLVCITTLDVLWLWITDTLRIVPYLPCVL